MKVINLVAGPGAGKSTIASDLFSLMKWNNLNVELVGEFAKDLVWEQRHWTFKDQLYLFAKQNHKLERLRGKVDYVITDSPLNLVHVYIPPDYYKMFPQFVDEVFHSYTNLNFLIEREKPYHAVGRNQNEEEARFLDIQIHALYNREHNVHRIAGNERAKHKILEHIREYEIEYESN